MRLTAEGATLAAWASDADKACVKDENPDDLADRNTRIAGRDYGRGVRRGAGADRQAPRRIERKP